MAAIVQAGLQQFEDTGTAVNRGGRIYSRYDGMADEVNVIERAVRTGPLR